MMDISYITQLYGFKYINVNDQAMNQAMFYFCVCKIFLIAPFPVVFLQCKVLSCFMFNFYDFSQITSG
jgi:hypothetical protein